MEEKYSRYAANKKAKKAVAKAKIGALKQIYEKLDTKKGEEKIYKLAKTRQRSGQAKQSVSISEDKSGKILTDDTKEIFGQMEIIF